MHFRETVIPIDFQLEKYMRFKEENVSDFFLQD